MLLNSINYSIKFILGNQEFYALVIVIEAYVLLQALTSKVKPKSVLLFNFPELTNCLEYLLIEKEEPALKREELESISFGLYVAEVLFLIICKTL